MNNVEQDTEIRDLWVYIREWNDKFGRLPKDEDELASCIDYVMKRQKLSRSEEDRKHIDNIISLLNQVKEEYVRKSGQFPSWITEILWLESIKHEQNQYDKGYNDDYSAVKYNHWKPSKEQMEALNAINIIGEISYVGQGNLLIELYNELKKL